MSLGRFEAAIEASKLRSDAARAHRRVLPGWDLSVSGGLRRVVLRWLLALAGRFVSGLRLLVLAG